MSILVNTIWKKNASFCCEVLYFVKIHLLFMTTVVKIVAESYDRWWTAELVSEDKSSSCRLSCQFCFDWKTLSANVQFFRKIVDSSKFFKASPLQENYAPIIFSLNDKKRGNIILRKLDVLKCQKKIFLIESFSKCF